ncbi:hypothetical protein MSAN_02429000 [Mycena sanguinolenta]|uniref:Uncharacterized protein n=1 Tax=Mycena sanguinolenta TaxID=230812 RepID=A0A8H6X2X4_9AGAR|nr:hypothetical protein MSAN_02429000 [Mycena sanguinolenta]
MVHHTHSEEECGYAPPAESVSSVAFQFHLYGKADSVQFRYAGAFFPNSRHLVVEGGTFTNNTISILPADYLRIPLGSIDLRNEIRLEPAGVISRNRGQGAVRRLYSARVGCRNKPMTVALYQGDHAEEARFLYQPEVVVLIHRQEWRKSVSIHSGLRHPHILQIYGTASSSRIQAAVFHDDLIPFDQFLESFHHSAILQAYIIAYTVCASFTENGTKLMFPESQDELEAYQYCRPSPGLGRVALWIRPLTGRLCAEVGGIGLPLWRDLPREVQTLPPPDSIRALHDPNHESWLIASVGFYQWYPLFRDCLTQYRYSNVSVQVELKLNSIMCWPSGCQFEDAKEIAWVVPSPVRELRRWNHQSHGMLREDGSVSYNSGDAFGKTFTMNQDNHSVVSWLSQANRVFSQLKILSGYEDYVLVNCVRFSLYISVPEHTPPDGYLFLCSPADFETGSVSYGWPDRPAYWSHDPSGGMPLSVEEATNSGFPPIRLSTTVHGMFWNETVYAGLRKFHVGKGVDPERQDVAFELGYPLYELSVPVPDARGSDLAANRDEEIEQPNSSDEFVQDDSLDCDNTDSVEGYSLFGEVVELVKFVLIVVVAVMHLYEHARLAS